MFTVPDYDSDDYPGPKLYGHPFVANRLLTIPHLKRVLVNDGKGQGLLAVENPNGVTYWEACAVVGKRRAPSPVVCDN